MRFTYYRFDDDNERKWIYRNICKQRRANAGVL